MKRYQAPDDRDRRSIERQLAARSVLGFGENCQGPVLDMAISPGGERAPLTLSGFIVGPP